MARNANNALLQQAKKNKKDEFYTLLPDIERELEYYTPMFRGKTVYCNCDDFETSQFCLYFVKNFNHLGLKSFYASCYKPGHNNLFTCDSSELAYGYEYYEEGDTKPGQGIVVKTLLTSDGDFRSQECIDLLKKSDIVVTNPPFSLFREFVAQLVRYDKKFLIIGNINALTYKEIFELIQTNRAWMGIHMGRGISGFRVPEDYDLYGTETKVNEDGERLISPNNCMWLTNLETPYRREKLVLTQCYEGNEDKYPKYDNYDGINIDKTQDIPRDYDGAMGVPITFLHKFNPSQFDIIKFRKGNDDKDLSINGKCPYFRIIIKHKNSKDAV